MNRTSKFFNSYFASDWYYNIPLVIFSYSQLNPIEKNFQFLQFYKINDSFLLNIISEFSRIPNGKNDLQVWT